MCRSKTKSKMSVPSYIATEFAIEWMSQCITDDTHDEYLNALFEDDTERIDELDEHYWCCARHDAEKAHPDWGMVDYTDVDWDKMWAALRAKWRPVYDKRPACEKNRGVLVR